MLCTLVLSFNGKLLLFFAPPFLIRVCTICIRPDYYALDLLGKETKLAKAKK